MTDSSSNFRISVKSHFFSRAKSSVTRGIQNPPWQRYSRAGVDEKTEFFFRVGQNYRNVYLTASADGKEIFRKKLRRAAPGEMEHVSFKGDALSAIRKAKELTFAIREEEKA